MANLDLGRQTVGNEVNIKSIESETKENKPEYIGPTDWLDKDIKSDDNDKMKTDCIASESGYVTSDSEDSDTEHGDESEIIRNEAQNATKQERMASIFVY